MFLAASEQAGLPLAQDLVNTAVFKTFVSLFAPVGRFFALATRDPVLKVFPDAIEAGTARISVTASTADTRVRSPRFSIEKNGVGPGGGWTPTGRTGGF